MIADQRPGCIREFLQALFAGKPDGLYILLWTLADKQSQWFSDVDSAIKWVEQLDESDVYVGVSLSGQDYGPVHRCVSDDAAGLVGLWMDIDLKSGAHKNPNLPNTVEEAVSILPVEMPPSMIVFTGNGIHVWWLFREPWIFQSADDRQEAAALAMRWNTLIRDNGRVRGWKLDLLKDLARILRIPGTTNCKDPANLKTVTLHSQSNRRYNPEDIEEFLDDHGVPDSETEEAAQKQFAERFKDIPLKIDLSATVPEAKLDLWLSSNKRFENSWFRQRPDLPDQSQSGYDFALVNFGIGVGLDAQGIVDMIIHHRRIHRQKPRTSLDYFHRTLSKVFQNPAHPRRTDPASEPSSFADKLQEPDGTTSQKPGDESTPLSDWDKIQLCKKISTVLGIEILRATKLSGANPIYRLECPEGKIDFLGAGKLMHQPSFRSSIAATVSRVVPKLNGARWDGLVQLILDACIVEDGGQEMESGGQIRIYLDRYLEENILIGSVEELIGANKHRPCLRNGRVAISSGDLQIFLSKTGHENLSIPQLVAMLTSIGAKAVRIRKGKTIKEQGRWELPLDEFDPADYAPVESV